MVGGYRSCFLTYITVLLLCVCLHDAVDSSCQRVIHKKVGETVELPSCSTSEGVTMAQWKYGTLLLAEKDVNLSTKHQFTGRLELNLTNFSLTVSGLTLQDSGDFIFISEVNDKQRETVTINLQIHEPITEEPVVNYNSTWHSGNESCTVFLQCSATSDPVTYRWAVRSQVTQGPRLQYVTRVQGDTTFTCTVSNVVSEKSTVKTVECRNFTSVPPQTGQNVIVLLSVAGGACVMLVVIVVVAVCVCHRKKSQEDVDINDLTVYADINDVAIEGTLSSMKSCTLYETIASAADTPGPQTVYDKIQLNRTTEASVSPYQYVS